MIDILEKKLCKHIKITGDKNTGGSAQAKVSEVTEFRLGREKCVGGEYMGFSFDNDCGCFGHMPLQKFRTRCQYVHAWWDAPSCWPVSVYPVYSRLIEMECQLNSE